MIKRRQGKDMLMIQQRMKINEVMLRMEILGLAPKKLPTVRNRGRPQRTGKGGGRVKKASGNGDAGERASCLPPLSPGRRQSGVSRVRDCLGPET